jgi:ribosomal protein S18 acetylase RimI-like enzyme
LQVNKDNKAVEFYKKVGFHIEKEALFDIGHGFVMDDYIMAYWL